MSQKTDGPKRLTRSSTDKMIAGVCGGLGEYFDLDATVFRIIFVVLGLLSGFGVVLYLILILVIPPANLIPGK